MAEGVRRALPTVELVLVPMADGGDGTLAILTEALGGELSFAEVRGPLGEPLRAPLGLLSDGSAVVEMALASGLQTTVDSAPLRASSVGTGQLIANARRRVPDGRVIVGVGGSASTDGGTGAATAVGWRFLDGGGRDLPPGGGSLEDLAAIVAPDRIPERIVAACDVMSPPIGETGAARRFAPQKGAAPHEVERLERGLERLLDVIERDVGVDLASLPGGGAGGGMGAGLRAFFGAEVRPGFDVVADAVGLDRSLAGASLVITGEGRLDEASVTAKVPGGVGARAKELGVPCAVVAGEVAVGADVLESAGFAGALGAVSFVGAGALSDPPAAIAATTAALVESLSPPW